MLIKNRNEKFINHYLKQTHKLSEEIKEFIKLNLNEEVLLYALVDLDEGLKFCEHWVVVTKNHLILAHEREGKALIEKTIQLSKVSRVRESRSLSCSSLTFIEADDMPALLKLNFTHRQKIIMGHIKYFCEAQEEISFQDETESTYQAFGLEFSESKADDHYQSSIMKPILEAQNSVTTENGTTLQRLLSYLLPYKKELFIGSCGAIATTLVSLVPAYLSGKLIDDVIRPFQDGQLSLEEASMLGWIMVASLGITYLLRELFIFIRLNKMSILGEKVAMDLRREFYAHLQTLSMDFYSKKQTGSIISRVSSDTDRIWDFVAFGVVEVAIACITLVGLATVLISMDWKLGLILAVPVPFLLVGIYLHGEKMKKLFLRAWRKWSRVTAVLSDTIPGIQVVKAFNQEEKEKERFDKRNQEVTEEFNEIHKAWTKFWPLLLLSFQMMLLTVWCFALPRLITEDQNSKLSAGTFVSSLLYMTMFIAPIEVLGQVARMLNRALSSAYRIFEVLDTRPTIISPEKPIKVDQIKGDVEFKNVFFSYDGVRPILKNLSFKIKAGEMIGLVGSSGGGKSTITKLIARFYDTNGGEITIDGVPLKKLELGKFRRQVGMVLQEPYLFHGTVMENISYGAPEATRMQIIEAAKIANAHDFIGKLNMGYDTIIGERGHTLSGGERQRISIARAVLANPRILILDEATSAVDTETERNIQDALDRLVKGRTVFAVAHRLSTLRKADRIFVVGKGSINEEGTHEELLTKDNGEYRKLHEMQREMNEEFAL